MANDALIGFLSLGGTLLWAVTPGTSPLPNGPCRCIIVDADGTVNLTTKAGVQRNGVLVFKGYNPLVATHIRAAAGPTKVQAGY